MLKKIGMVIVGATLVVAHCLIGGTAFALYQDDGQPCPPECVTDSMEIVTWYPSPYNEYEELRLYPVQRDDNYCTNDKIGLMYYDDGGTPSFADDDKMRVCKGTLLGWQEVGGGAYWDVSPSDSNDIYYTPSGNVGIGTNSPSYKLDVRNGRTNVSELCINEDCKTTWPAGVNGTEIPTASVSSLKGYIEVKIGNNFYALPYYNYVLNQALSMGSHTTHDCINAGGTAVVENSVRFCKFSASSCPIGWTPYQDWSTTEVQSCSIQASCTFSCTTSSHNWSNNSTVETCTYGFTHTMICGGSCCGGGLSYTCFATKKEVGCW